MATTNKSLIQQTYNTGTGNLPANQIVDPAWISTPYSNWSVPVNYDFGAIDLALGGSVSISVTSVVVSPQSMVLSQYQPMSIIFTGVLSANLAYALPSSVGGTWAVYNNTTGAFTLTMTTPAGSSLSVVIPNGGPYLVVCNSTTGISISQPFIADGSITAAKLFGTTGTGNVVLASSPALTGTATSITPAAGNSSTAIATTAFVQGEILTVLRYNTTATISVGYNVTPSNRGTGSGTVVPDASNGNYQFITNNGAFTIGAPAADCAIDIIVYNGGSAGSISFSGFRTPGTNATGNTFVPTAGTFWILSVRRVLSYSFYAWNGPWT